MLITFRMYVYPCNQKQTYFLHLEAWWCKLISRAHPHVHAGPQESQITKVHGLAAEQICNSTPTRSHSDCDMDIRNQFSNLLYDFLLKSQKVWFINRCCVIFLSLSIQFSICILLKTVFQIGYMIPTLNFQFFIGNVPLKLVCSSKMLIQVSLELKPLSILLYWSYFK